MLDCGVVCLELVKDGGIAGEGFDVRPLKDGEAERGTEDCEVEYGAKRDDSRGFGDMGGGDYGRYYWHAPGAIA